MKAVWLTNTDSKLLTSRSNLIAGFDRLAGLGFDTVYPVVWQRGYTLYPSPVAKAWLGAEVMPDYRFQGRDFLAEIIEIATAKNMRVIPWFEYGLMSPADATFVSKYPELITLDRAGDRHRIIRASNKQDPHVWLNPARSQVREFITNLIMDLIDRYPVAGIQLDDRFAFPIELGYDPFSLSLFTETYGYSPSQTDRDSDWQTWGTQILTDFLINLVTVIRQKKSNLQISISPNPLTFSQQNYRLDWLQWHHLGAIDELVLQVYRDNFPAFDREISKPEAIEIATEIPTLIGILTGLRTKPIADDLIERQINTILDRQFTGYACFFYETIFHSQLSPTKIRRPNLSIYR
jgi:uncharacterized lipoprotein YddW (UPF0748 family)